MCQREGSSACSSAPEGPCLSVLTSSTDARERQLLVLMERNSRPRRRRSRAQKLQKSSDLIPEIQNPNAGHSGLDWLNTISRSEESPCHHRLAEDGAFIGSPTRHTAGRGRYISSISQRYGTEQVMRISIRPSPVIRLIRRIPARPGVLFGRIELSVG